VEALFELSFSTVAHSSSHAVFIPVTELNSSSVFLVKIACIVINVFDVMRERTGGEL